MIITVDLIASFISVLSFSKRMRPFLRLGGPVKDPNIDHSFMTFLTVDALLPQNLAVSLIAYNEEKSYHAMKNIMNCRLEMPNKMKVIVSFLEKRQNINKC